MDKNPDIAGSAVRLVLRIYKDINDGGGGGGGATYVFLVILLLQILFLNFHIVFTA